MRVFIDVTPTYSYFVNFCHVVTFTFECYEWAKVFSENTPYSALELMWGLSRLFVYSEHAHNHNRTGAQCAGFWRQLSTKHITHVRLVARGGDLISSRASQCVQETERSKMWIQVKTMDGRKSARVDSLSKLTTIEELRERLVGEFGAEPERQRLFYRGKQVSW